MLTPQEVAERSFPKAKFGGYGMVEVDEFLDILTEDYSALYKENAVLKNKMKVLVEKIAEYRNTEDAMRTTLLTAQKMASTMIADAEKKKADIVKEAEAAVQERLDELHKSVADEQARLETAQSATASLVAQIKDACKKHLMILETLPNVVAAPPVPAQDDSVDAAAEEINSSLNKIVAAEAENSAEIGQGIEKTMQDGQSAEAKTEVTLDDLEAQATRRIDFENLQFGRDYKIK